MAGNANPEDRRSGYQHLGELPLQLRAYQVARNVIFNWLGAGTSMLVGLFLSPYIIRHLGDVAYGVWVLAISVVMYLGILDLGMQSSVLRFVSKGHTQGDHAAASDAISAALWVRLQIAALILILSAILSAVFPTFFKIPSALAGDAQKAILLIGTTTALTMSVGVFGGVLSGLNRYDLQNYVGFAQTAIRVTGVILVLRYGHGIVAIAACEFGAALFGNCLIFAIARRLYPELTIRIRKPKWEVLRQIWSYSFYAFLTTIALQLIYQTDNLVVGAFVSASAVTFYSIGNSLCRYASLVVGSMTGTFVPAASTYEAAGDSASLLALYKNGTRATLMISLPILVTLMVRGKTFIGLWMGPHYASDSGKVLLILAIPLFFAFANLPARSIAFGIEKHKTIAQWSLGEGVANLILSVVLVHWFGIYGVAFGTLIPSVIVQIGLWPRYVSELVGLNAFQVIWKIWTPAFLSAVPFAVASYFVDRFYPTRHLYSFALQVLATLPVFAITVSLVFRVYITREILPRIRSLVSSAA